MAAYLPMDTAQLVALFLESLLFGMFCILYSVAVYILLLRGDGITKANHRLFFTATLMFVLAIVHMAIDVRRSIIAFVVFGDREAGGSVKFFVDVREALSIAKDGIYTTQTLVGDAFVTYRMYVIWDRNIWIVILPSLMVLATGVVGYGACYEEAISSGIFDANIRPWITAFFSISLSTNVLATGLIAFRVWQSSRRVRKYRAGGRSHWPILETIIHSAAIYSAALCALIGCYAADSFAQFLILDAMTPLIGVVFTLIIIRVGLGYSGHASSDATPEARGPVGLPQDFQLRPVAINVQVSRHRDQSLFEQFDKTSKRDDADIESSGTFTPS